MFSNLTILGSIWGQIGRYYLLFCFISYLICMSYMLVIVLYSWWKNRDQWGLFITIWDCFGKMIGMGFFWVIFWPMFIFYLPKRKIPSDQKDDLKEQ